MKNMKVNKDWNKVWIGNQMANKRIQHRIILTSKSESKIARQINIKFKKQSSPSIDKKISTAGKTTRKIILIIQWLRRMVLTKIAGKQCKWCKIIIRCMR